MCLRRAQGTAVAGEFPNTAGPKSFRGGHHDLAPIPSIVGASDTAPASIRTAAAVATGKAGNSHAAELGSTSAACGTCCPRGTATCIVAAAAWLPPHRFGRAGDMAIRRPWPQHIPPCCTGSDGGCSCCQQAPASPASGGPNVGCTGISSRQARPHPATTARIMDARSATTFRVASTSQETGALAFATSAPATTEPGVMAWRGMHAAPRGCLHRWLRHRQTSRGVPPMSQEPCTLGPL